MSVKKFFGVIGNPPYQDETIGDQENYTPPIYHLFLDEAYKVGDHVEMITPARFLFNAGGTPKAWNKKMLEDPHLKILKYDANENELFPGVTIIGGLAVSYRDQSRAFGEIGIFTPYEELNSILRKTTESEDFSSLSELAVTSYAYHFTDVLYEEHPELKGSLSEGHDYDLKSNVFEKMPAVFHASRPNDGRDYIRIYGRENNERTHKYIRRDYINDVKNLDGYKVFLARADGAAGTLGRPIPARISGAPVIGEKGVGSTEVFMSIGNFNTEEEACNLLTYIKTRFVRTLLGVLKVTQTVTPEKWKYVPVQDFTSSSDIDWRLSVEEIDLQLYEKYGFTGNEINFIETYVKEMQ